MKRGFTLAELLLALVILGVIATFTIPKVLTSQQADQRRAVLKETFGAFSEFAYTRALSGELSSSTYINLMKTQMNAVKVCNNASTDGCWPGSSTAGSNTSTAPGLVLHNGAMVTDLETSGANSDIVWVDWNGPAGPNQNCNDQVPMLIAYGTGADWSSTVRIGLVYPWSNPPFTGGSTCTEAPYVDLFSK